MIIAANSFSPATLKEERYFSHDRQLACCRFSRDGAWLFAAGFDGLLHRWSLADDQHAAFPAHRGWVETMALHPDGDSLFTADSWGQVHCWPTRFQPAQFAPKWSVAEANTSWLRRLAVSPDGRHVATCGNDNMARVFSATGGKLVIELPGHEHCVQSLAFHQDGESLATGDQHGVVKHWNIESGKCVRELDAGKLFKVFHQYEQGGVRAMTFDSDFATLYCAGFVGSNANQAHGDPTVLAFDWRTGEQVIVMRVSQSFKGPILDIAYHPDGHVIGAGSSEAGGALWFWKPGEEKESHMIKNATSFRGLDVSANGARIAAASFGDRGGQRGGNGRRLTKDGEYIGFAGGVVLYAPEDKEKTAS